MRFLDLQLLRFGHFTGHTLDFGAGDGLHVIFGANEAGKSTARRAVTDLLFGVPHNTGDAHTHNAPLLRIGARLEAPDGRRLHVVRRKGRKDTLLHPDESPLDEAELAACLGGVGREVFETMFGLSHEALVRGGRDLLEGRGQVGESLFAASAGIQGMHQLTASLRDEASEVFKPGGSKPLLNRALGRFHDARRSAREAALKPSDWERARDALADAQRRFDALGRERDGLQGELTRLERLARALPRLHQRAERLQRLTGLGPLALLPEEAREERLEAERDLRGAKARLAQLEEQRQQRASERDALEVSDALLEQGAQLRTLRKQLGAEEKARDDLSMLRERAAGANREARAALRRLGEPDDLEVVDRLRVDTGSRERVRKLGRDGARVHAEWAGAEDALSTARRTLAAKCRDLATLPAAREADALARVVALVRKRGDLEGELREGELAAETAARDAQARTASLGLWAGRAEDAPALPIPPASTRDRYGQRFEELRREGERLREKHSGAATRLEEIEDRLASLAASGDLPSEDDLVQARLVRDHTWGLVRDAWIEGAPSKDTPDELAGRYESASGLADGVVDGLRSDADRVATSAKLREEQQRVRQTCAQLEDELEAHGKRVRAASDEWAALWAPCGLEPLPPAEMRDWVEAHAALVRAIDDSARGDAARRALVAEIATLRAQVARELVKLDEPGAAEDEPLAARLDRAEAVVTTVRGVAQSRRAIEESLAEAKADHAAKEAKRDARRRALDAWAEAHAAAMTRLGMPTGASPEEADAILEERTRLFDHLEEAAGSESRARSIERDADAFGKRVRMLTDVCAPDLAEAEPEVAAALLADRYEEATRNYTRREALDRQLADLDEDHREQLRARTAAQHEFARLCERAGCTDASELVAAEERSREHRELSRQIRDLELQIAEEGRPLEALEADAAALEDEDQLPARIAQRTERVRDLGHQRDAAKEEVGTLKSELAAMDGGDAAARAAAEAQGALADIHTHVEAYTRARLASLILDREIKRFAEEHQGPLLRRTGEIFAAITLGAFARVVTGFDARDELVVLCQRATGERVPVEGLSDGTRDQLYLALRLAALEAHIDRAGPFPLIVDDILVHFDDQRSRATLEVLAALAARTQILFFTHHARLLELAREAVPAGCLREHRLEAA